MFYLNLGYRWKISQELDDIDSVIYLASGSSRYRLLKKIKTNFSHILFDPQLYLASLRCQDAESICGRLATHPWFGVDGVDDYKSADETRSAWERRIKEHAKEHWRAETPTDSIEELASSCILYQMDLNCTQIILPSPLVSRREDEGEELGHWLDASLEAVDEHDPGVPVLASVALSDTVLDKSVFEQAGLLDSLVDQVTSREGIDGVYIVVAQSARSHPLLPDMLVHKAYAKLSSEFSYQYDTVLTNFADVFGLACYSVGATSFATGETQSTRRLSLAASKGGRSPYPVYYSHRALGEFLPETDLDKVQNARALKWVQDDTQFSSALLRRLRMGGSASELPRWAESPGNTAQAAKHFLTKMHQQDRELSALDTDERKAAVESWLDDADASQVVLSSRCDGKFKGVAASASVWSGTLAELG